MLKKILISFIFTSQICFAQSTYNFYFNDSGSGPSGPSSPMATPAPIQQPQPTYINNAPVLPVTASSPYAFSIMDTYLNIGVGAQSYLHNKPSIFLKTKFLPLIGFEASLPNVGNSFSGYRAAAYLEGGFFDFLRVQLLGGALQTKKSGSESVDPYVGIGLSLRLFKAIEISVSANTTIKSKLKFNEDDLLSVGGYKFASGAVSIDIFKLFHLL